jgi:hypothetical protein
VRRALPFLLLALAVVAAAVASSLFLLRSAGAGNDRVGRLSPVAPWLSGTTTPAPSPPAATTTSDDHRGGRHDEDD